MQAIARVNRVYRDKPGGLVVDYLGLADQLKQALAARLAGRGHQDGLGAGRVDVCGLGGIGGVSNRPLPALR